MAWSWFELPLGLVFLKDLALGVVADCAGLDEAAQVELLGPEHGHVWLAGGLSLACLWEMVGDGRYCDIEISGPKFDDAKLAAFSRRIADISCLGNFDYDGRATSYKLSTRASARRAALEKRCRVLSRFQYLLVVFSNADSDLDADSDRRVPCWAFSLFISQCALYPSTSP